MKIYIASSWKNANTVKSAAIVLRNEGFEVDAFCDASRGRYVFGFDQLPDVSQMNAMTVLETPEVQRAFAEDKKWIDWADVVLLMLPAGKSAHLEAGYAKGCGKTLIIYEPYFPTGEFDVMYGFADVVTDNWRLVLSTLGELDMLSRELKIIEREKVETDA